MDGNVPDEKVELGHTVIPWSFEKQSEDVFFMLVYESLMNTLVFVQDYGWFWVSAWS